LDDYCVKNHINKIDLLKIDTQGREDEILKGAKTLLKIIKLE
jgi:FkbM family methyltransferase